MKKIFSFVFMVFIFFANKSFGQEIGINNDPFQKSVGERPYEMKDRKEIREPFLLFDDCTKWKVITKTGAAKLYRTQEQKMIGDYSGKVIFQSDTSKEIHFRVELVKPIGLKKDWDCINFWNYGPVWLWEDGPAIYHSLILKDARGKEIKIPFVQEWLWPYMCYKYWYMDHIKLNDSVARPVTFVGMEFKGTAAPQLQHDIFLGPLYAYKEILKPLNFKAFPKKCLFL